MDNENFSGHSGEGSYSGKLWLFDRPGLHIVLVALLGLIAYSNTFGVPFQFDDVLLYSKRLGDLSAIPSLFWDLRDYFGSRPLLLATISLNYHFGGVDALGYHAVNLALHLANSAFLYFLITMTGRRLGYAERDVRHTALFSAALFVLHPIQTEAVTNIVGRSMLLSTSFYLSGMILFLKAVTAERRRGLFIAGLLATSLLGMASRENFATFPLMLVLYDLFFISRFSLGEVLKHYKAYAPAFLSLGYLAYLSLNSTYNTATDYPGIGMPHKDYFLTQFGVHWTYLRLLVLPINQNVDYDYPGTGTILKLPSLLAFLGYVGLWAGSVFLAKRRPVAAFSVLWFLVTLLPISFLVTFMDLRLDDVIFEHRLYLPGAAFFALAGVLLASRRPGRENLRIAAVVILLVIPIVLAVASYQRNSLWRSRHSLWEDAVRKSPQKARPYNNLGIAYNKTGQLEKAFEELQIAINLRPDYATAHYNLGIVYENMGLPEKAIEHYRTAIRLKPKYASAHNNLGSVLGDRGQLEEAIEHFQIALELNPGNAATHNNLGVAYQMMGLKDKAEEHFRQAQQLGKGK